MTDLSPFARSIFERTYAFTPDETWEQCAARVAKAVANDAKQEQAFFEIIRDRVFLPGGRYLATAGRPKFANANCYGFLAGDSREAWGDLLRDSVICLSMGGGLGVNYCLAPGTKILTTTLSWVSVEKLDVGVEIIGFNEEPIRMDRNLLRPSVVQSISRIIRPTYLITTDRESVIASAEHLWVARASKTTKRKKGQGYQWVATDRLGPNWEIAFTAVPWDADTSFDGGWLSGMFDGEGCVSATERHRSLSIGQNPGPILDRIACLLRERGIDFGLYKNTGNSTYQIVPRGKWNMLSTLGMLRPYRLLPKARLIWEHKKLFGKHQPPARVLSVKYLGEQEVIGVGTSTGTLIANGFLSHNSAVRGMGEPVKGMGGYSSGPAALMSMLNEVGRSVMAGGKRRSALWAGLNWNHPDIEAFVSIKNWDEDIRAMKAKRFDARAELDMTNISVIIGDQYLQALESGDVGVVALHNKICAEMLRTGEPGFFNLSLRLRDDPGAVTTNGCTESSLHPHDTCNLGSIVLPRIRDFSHLENVVRLSIRFLYNGSVKAQYPTERIAGVARRNRRIGLGLMGLHEWMLLNHHKYEWFPKLEAYLQLWKDVSDEEATRYSQRMGDAEPIARRAIAPTGTISIIAETTSGIEPVFCSAYRRRYIDAGQFKFQYVVDPTVKRLMQLGVTSKDIEDAYQLSYDIRRRLEVNAQVQRFVDQAISSTINLPAWEQGSVSVKEFVGLMQEYLPKLKGITTYPNNSRSGQPLVPIYIDEALGQEGVVYEEDGERCSQGVCGL